MLEQFRLFLGPARIRALILLLGLTGLLSLILNALDAEDAAWVTSAQTLLVLIFLIGAVVIVAGRMDSAARLRWLSILAPSIGALILGVTVLPHLLLPLAGAAVGWVIAVVFLFQIGRAHVWTPVT